MVQNGNRRALEDIRNCAGGPCTRFPVAAPSEGNADPPPRNIVAVDRPVMRLGAIQAKARISTQVDRPAAGEDKKNVKRRGKQRTNDQSSRLNNQRRDGNEGSAVVVEDCRVSEHHALEKPFCTIMTRSRAAAVRIGELSIITTPALQNLDRRVSNERQVDEEEDLLQNIDDAYSGNPMAAVGYVEDIFRYYRRTEVLGCVPPNYMSRQPHINERLRAALIDWIIEVHRKFECMQETLFLAVSMTDRYLSSHIVTIRELQMVGLTALFLACKHEEIHYPVLADYMELSDIPCTKDEILDLEKNMLNAFQYDIFVPTPNVFLKKFLNAAESEFDLEMVASFLIELCLVEYGALKYPPSMIAAAATYTARCVLQKVPFWNEALKRRTTYSEDQLKPCARLMVQWHQNAGQGRHTSVYKKYSVPDFCFAAKNRPAVFL